MGKKKTLADWRADSQQWRREAQRLARELSLTQLELGRVRSSYNDLLDRAMTDPPVRGVIEFHMDNSGSYHVVYDSFMSLVRYITQATEPVIHGDDKIGRLEFGFRRLRSIKLRPDMPYRGR